MICGQSLGRSKRMSRWQKIGKYVTIRNYTVYFSAKADNGLLAGEMYGKKNKELSCVVTKFHDQNNKVRYFDSERKVPAYIQKKRRKKEKNKKKKVKNNCKQ